ncbi:ubiquinol-cytochrome C chaperone family protein [Emcibacter sp. SYSU 3D8]|uniref:ubiquinol-cytochrome C chaperone family protein n=1 Tax=Emcibacter sp. SYSU 3D8 TaxID=3133969 RepID=UPI0031FEE8FA
MLQFLKNIRRAFMPSPDQLRANALYNTAVNQSRRTGFYTTCGVPDTIDGRFDMIVVHAFLIMRRLRDGGPDGEALSQVLFDEMFADMDRSLREMGVGDMGIGRRVRAMGKAFMGRVKAYEEALEEGGAALEEALTRNVYRDAAPAPAALDHLAAYMRRENTALRSFPIAALMAGEVNFGPAPGDSP